MQPSKERGFYEWKLPLRGGGGGSAMWKVWGCQCLWKKIESSMVQALFYPLRCPSTELIFFNNIVNNFVTLWSWVPRKCRGFNFWQSQPLNSYAPWLENWHLHVPPSLEFPRQWKQAAFTLIISAERKGERGGGTCTIQRLNKVSGHLGPVVRGLISA